jgi:hypothetical protein
MGVSTGASLSGGLLAAGAFSAGAVAFSAALDGVLRISWTLSSSDEGVAGRPSLGTVSDTAAVTAAPVTC